MDEKIKMMMPEKNDSARVSAVNALVMPKAFEVELALGDDNSPVEIETMRKSFFLTDDACDCGAKGLVLGQLYDHPSNKQSFLFRGKFIFADIANKIIDLAKEA